MDHKIFPFYAGATSPSSTTESSDLCIGNMLDGGLSSLIRISPENPEMTSHLLEMMSELSLQELQELVELLKMLAQEEMEYQQSLEHASVLRH